MKLLQLPCGWILTQKYIDIAGVTINLRSSRKTAHCPDCLKHSTGVHSYRRRRIQHLPSSGQPLWLVFSIRHWYYRNSSCARKIFAKSLTPFAGAHQQSSQALQDLQQQLGLIAGGEAGRRAATAVGLKSSADTLLRRGISVPKIHVLATPHIGIDKWAWRRGHR